MSGGLCGKYLLHRFFIYHNMNIEKQLNEIKSLILLSSKKVLTIEEVALFTDLSVSCLYKKTCAKQIPFYRSGKRIYFNRTEVEEWMMKNHINAYSESEHNSTDMETIIKSEEGGQL